MQAVQAAQAALDDFDTLPPLGTDAVGFDPVLFSFFLSHNNCLLSSFRIFVIKPKISSSFLKASQAWRKNKMDESKHEIHSQVDAITAGTASMVNLTAGNA